MASINQKRSLTSASSKVKSMSTAQTAPASPKQLTDRKRKSEAIPNPKNGPTSPSVAKRRKVSGTPKSARTGKATIIDLTGDDEDDVEIATPSRKKKAKAKTGQDEEKRLKMFRTRAPLSYLDKLHRAQTQRYGTSVNCQVSIANKKCEGCLLLIAQEAELKKLPKRRSISQAQRATFTTFTSESCLHARVLTIRKAISANI